MAKAHGNFIGGEWLAAGDIQPNLNPSDLSAPIGHYARGDASQARDAVAAARAAFPAWAARSPQDRADILDRAGTLILERREALGRLLSSEEGKVLAEGIGEVVRAGHIFKFMAGEALRLTGERLASTRVGVDVEITREPVGVFALITPWNFPIAIPSWKAAPALAFGNTVVLKPADATPGSAWALADILAEAGLPAGCFNLVMGPGRIIGDALVNDPSVDGVSFTGSVATGRAVAAKCAGLGKRVQCEMGGKNPLVVLDDADLDKAVNVALTGSFYSTGQRCTASSRLIVTDGVHDRFVAALTEAMAGLRIGHALDPSSEIGPVADRAQFDKDLDYIRVAADEGGRVVGGAAVRRETEGLFLEPALVLDTTPEMRINREEVFGPVAGVIRVRDYDQALHVANDTEFGLSAGICTESLSKARHFLRHAQAGMVMVNVPTAGVDAHVPFGGRKASSFGPREQGSYAREFYTTVKTGYIG
jgi:aldehyde dehydrogenase (NAD+)